MKRELFQIVHYLSRHFKRINSSPKKFWVPTGHQESLSLNLLSTDLRITFFSWTWYIMLCNNFKQESTFMCLQRLPQQLWEKIWKNNQKRKCSRFQGKSSFHHTDKNQCARYSSNCSSVNDKFLLLSQFLIRRSMVRPHLLPSFRGIRGKIFYLCAPRGLYIVASFFLFWITSKKINLKKQWWSNVYIEYSEYLFYPTVFP